MNSDITIQYLDKLYDDLQKEHQRLMTDMKNLNDESMSKEPDIQKQMTTITTIMTNTLKLKNFKKKLILKLS